MSNCPIYYPVSNYPHYVSAYPDKIHKKTSYYESCNKPPVSDCCLNQNYASIDHRLLHHPPYHYYPSYPPYHYYPPYPPYPHYHPQSTSDLSNNTINHPPSHHYHDASNNAVPTYPYPHYHYDSIPYHSQLNSNYLNEESKSCDTTTHSSHNDNNDIDTILTETCDSIPYSESEYNRILMGINDNESQKNEIIIGCNECYESGDSVCTDDIIQYNNENENENDEGNGKSVFVVKIPKKKGLYPAVQLCENI